MGLDLTVLPKPKPGHEAEFETLWREINEADGKLPKLTGRKPRKSLLGRLLARAEPRFDTEAARARFYEISDPAFSQLGAPVVGRDPEADAWLRARLEAGGLDAAGVAERLEQMKGYHVLALAQPCDGLPVYSNSGLGGGVDETSFRGEFLKVAEAVLTDLVMEAYLPMRAEDAVQTGGYMMRRAAEFAREYGVQHVLGDRTFVYVNDGDPATWAHIADQAGRWYCFWGAKGHGIDPSY